MLSLFRPAATLLALFTLLLGLAYPLAIVGIGRAFPGANGSPVIRDGVVVGSMLVGQSFVQERYFQPRPSATSAPDPQDSTKSVDTPYNAANSSGSNLGPLSQKLIDRVKSDVRGGKSVPGDAVTTSASGLDPHISPQNAFSQVSRVATARGLPEERIHALVANRIEEPLFNLLGERRVNVLILNLELDALK